MEAWVEEYITLLKENLKQEAWELKLKNIPSAFFKYRNLNDYTLNCLNNNSVWMASACHLNDPFESSLFLNDKENSRRFFCKKEFPQEFFAHFKREISKEEIEEIISDFDPELKFQEICKQKNIYRDFSVGKETRERFYNEYTKKTKSDMRISCFSERNDSILMWSHYSDGHKGICLQYNFQDNKDICNYVEPVYYTDKIFDLTPYISSGIVPFKVAAITKAKDWQYEQEWRITFPVFDDNPNNGYYNVPNPIAIFLGARFDENDVNKKESLFTTAKTLNIPIHSMNIHDSEFKIVPIL